MKNFKIFNKKLLLAIVLSGFVLFSTTACNENSRNSYVQDNSNNDEKEVIHSKTNDSDINKNKTVENYTTDDNNMVENNIETVIDKTKDENIQGNSKNLEEKIGLSDKDNVIILEFNKLKEKTEEILNSEEAKIAKDKSKGIFISIVDFLFYDGQIKGIKFSELTESGKKQVLLLANNIDTLIMNKFPDYKKDISTLTKDAYNKASELIKKGANNLIDFSKEKLGEDNYNAIINAKDELINYTKSILEIVGDFSSETIINVKEKIRKWYEEFRTN